jgi:hypothetical protein
MGFRRPSLQQIANLVIVQKDSVTEHRGKGRESSDGSTIFRGSITKGTGSGFGFQGLSFQEFGFRGS